MHAPRQRRGVRDTRRLVGRRAGGRWGTRRPRVSCLRGRRACPRVVLGKAPPGRLSDSVRLSDAGDQRPLCPDAPQGVVVSVMAARSRVRSRRGSR